VPQDYATKKQLLKALEEENYIWLGWQFWNAFATLPKTDKRREYHSKLWNKLTKKQQRACESARSL
jgi:hypothetical protein